MKFSIVSDFTGKAISEDRLLDEVDGYDEGNLSELNTIIGKSLKALEESDVPLVSIDLHMSVITGSLVEILNYISVLGSISDEVLYLGFGDKVIPCGVEITIDNESCTIDRPYKLYDDTLYDYVTSLELEDKVRDRTYKLLTANCPLLVSLAALLCLNDTEIKLADSVINQIYDVSTAGQPHLYNYIYDTPYTLDPIE